MCKGITRTEITRFFRPGIRRSVEEYIKQCAACIRRKAPTDNNKAPQQTIKVGEPLLFGLWTIWVQLCDARHEKHPLMMRDGCLNKVITTSTTLPETARGNRHILVAMDHFSKWCEAFLNKDQKETTVSNINILINKMFSRFGPPIVLHSDQGANFESNLMHKMCDLIGMAKTRTTAYHTQFDGQVKRQNRTLQDMFAAFVLEHRDDWDL